MKTLSFDPLIKFVCQNVPANRYPDANICEHMRLLFAAVACVKIHILHTHFLSSKPNINFMLELLYRQQTRTTNQFQGVWLTKKDKTKRHATTDRRNTCFFRFEIPSTVQNYSRSIQSIHGRHQHPTSNIFMHNLPIVLVFVCVPCSYQWLRSCFLVEWG